MPIDSQTLDKLASLSMLSLTEAEKTALRADLNDIIQMVDALKAVNTDGVAPLKTPLPMTQRYHEDEVTLKPAPSRYQQCAQKTEDGLYLVPQVIE